MPIHFCLSQSTVKIYGNVRDATTGLPLAGANVVVEGMGLGTSTDERGHFAIEDLYAGEYTLRVSYMGYESAILQNLTISMDQPLRLTVELKPSALTMPAVVIEAEKFADKSPVENRVILSGKAIQRSNVQNIAELLQTLPGIEINKHAGAGGRAFMTIRGSQANQVVVLIDGVPLSDALTGEVDLSSIPVASVQRIEISKGASAAAQGSGAIAGVMNIITKSIAKRKLEVKVDAGSFGNRNISSTLMSRQHDYSFLFIAEAGQADGNYPYHYRRVNGTEVQAKRENAAFTSRQLFATVSRTTRESHLKIMGVLHRSERGQPGLLYSLTPYAHASTGRGIVRFSFETSKPGGSLQSNLSFLRQLTAYSNLYPADTKAYRIVPSYHNQNLLRQMNGRINWKSIVTKSQKITIGLNWSDIEFRDRDLLQQYPLVGKARTTAFGVLLQHEWMLSPLFFDSAIMKTSVRYDGVRIRHDNLKFHDQFFSPFVGVFLSRQIIWHWQLMANYGRAFRLPTYADLFYQQYRTRGNINLMPERAISREFAIAASWHMAGQATARVSFFDNKINDLIIWRMGSFATFSPVNTDARISGKELEFNWQAEGKWLDISVFQTILHTENLSHQRTTHAKELPYRPRYATKARVQWQHKSIFANLSIRAIGKRFVTEANTISMPGYTVADVTVGKSWSWRGRDISGKISVYNLMNSDYQIIENAPLPGREWRLGLELRW